MDLFLDNTNKDINDVNLNISGSKSESNRLLILKQFYPDISLLNISDSDDTIHLQEAVDSKQSTVDIGHAGTAMRFLTAYFSVKEGSDIILTGSDRMQNRPIKILVDALTSLGADIQYLEKEGFPPLKIKGKKITKSEVKILGNVSSQYISALLLIAASIENGLQLELLGKVTSVPYIKMTLSLLEELGIKAKWNDNTITIFPKKSLDSSEIIVESDWSSASYFYSLIALSENGTLKLDAFKKNSLQGDHSLIEIYKQFGVSTTFDENTITLKKGVVPTSKHLDLDLANSPDLAQTIVVTCFGLGISCNLTGLHTLKIKETDRLVALQNELQKLGAEIDITDESMHLKISDEINPNIKIDTYDDHRMAMSFAPLSLKVPITINNAEVVTKSYANFWADFDQVLS